MEPRGHCNFGGGGGGGMALAVVASPVGGAIVSGIVEVSATHWLDVLKTHLQQGTMPPRWSTHFSSLSNVYRGYVPKLKGTVPMRTVFWTTQSFCNDLYASPHYGGMSRSTALVASGVTAGLLQTLVDCPVECVKTRAINRGLPADTALGSAARQPLRWHQYYRGMVPHTLRNGGFAVSVNVFRVWGREHAARQAQQDEQRRKSGAGGTVGRRLPHTQWFGLFVMPALGGVVGAVLTQPLDYVKTVRQNGTAVGIGTVGTVGTSLPLLLSSSWCSVVTSPQHRPHLMRGWMPRAGMAFVNMGIGGLVFNFMELVWLSRD